MLVIFSSFVIIFSIAIAFSTSARAFGLGIFRSSCSYITGNAGQGKSKEVVSNAHQLTRQGDLQLLGEEKQECINSNDSGVLVPGGGGVLLLDPEAVYKRRSETFTKIATARFWRRRR